ncbi:hypothetical protein BH09VER1_BH09VER1_30480 [soil metagenome]
MLSRVPLFFGLVSLTTLPLFAQDAPPANVSAILQDLDKIEQQQKQTILSARQSATAQIRAAANSPSAADALYLQAIEATQFDGIKNKGGNFAEWKSGKAALLRSKEMQAILSFHLRYLALSLERFGSDKPELFAQPAYDYVKELAAYDAAFIKLAQKGPDSQSQHDKDEAALNKEILNAKKELLGTPLTDSVFVKWLRLEPFLPKEDWELKPGDISGILDKDVRSVFRKSRDPRLIETWEYEMKVKADRVTATRLDHDATDFNTVTRPQMQFNRANDMILIGQKNRGIAEIYSMIKTYPTHADFSQWVQRLRELLKTSAPAPAAAAESPAAPATSSAGPGTTQP